MNEWYEVRTVSALTYDGHLIARLEASEAAYTRALWWWERVMLGIAVTALLLPFVALAAMLSQ